MSQEATMVTAGRIAEEFDIPRSTLYRLVNEGRIPAHEVTKAWHKRRQFAFNVSEVRQAIEESKRQPTHP